MDAITAALAAIGAEDASRVTVGTAVVTGVSAQRDRVTVNHYGGISTARKLRSYVPSAGDVVLTISAGGTLWVLDSIGPHAAEAAPGEPTTPSIDPPDSSRPDQSAGTLSLPATTTGTWRPQGGWMNDSDLYQGTGYGYGPHKGLWFYGAGPQTALAGWEIAGIAMFVQRRSAGGVNAAQQINLHSHATAGPSGGEPSLTPLGVSVSLARGQSAWVDLPVSAGQALVDGAIRGFGIASNPYVVMDGLSRTSASGSLRMTYMRGMT